MMYLLRLKKLKLPPKIYTTIYTVIIICTWRNIQKFIDKCNRKLQKQLDSVKSNKKHKSIYVGKLSRVANLTLATQFYIRDPNNYYSTVEVECQQKLPFLYFLVCLTESNFEYSIHRKPTNENALLPFFSFHDIKICFYILYLWSSYLEDTQSL